MFLCLVSGEDGMDLVQDEMAEALFVLVVVVIIVSTMVANPIYRGTGPLPKY